MDHTEFALFLHELGQHRFVQPSESIDEAMELLVRDTLVCLEWNGDQQRLELTVPLPELLGDADPDSLRLRLYRALIAWQWIEAAHAQHLRFGEIGGSGQIVGMASIGAAELRCAAQLDAAVVSAHADLQAAWLQLGQQVLADEVAAQLAQALPPAALPPGR